MSGKLYSSVNEWITATYVNMDKSPKHTVEWGKQIVEGTYSYLCKVLHIV